MTRLALLALAAWTLAGLAGCAGAESGKPAEPPVAAAAPDAAGLPVPEPGAGDPEFEQALQQRLGAAPAPAEEAPVERRRALEAYEAARAAIVERGELEAGIARLEEAVALDPAFAEAWYELGTARVTHALHEIASGHDEDAVAAYLVGIDEQRRARSELRAGNARVDDSFAWHEKLDDLATTLDEADRWLQAPERLPAELRERAEAFGFVEPEPSASGPGDEQKPR